METDPKIRVREALTTVGMAELECPLCGAADDFATAFEWSEVSNILPDNKQKYQNSNRRIWFALLLCNHCGHTMRFNLETLGIHPGDYEGA